MNTIQTLGTHTTAIMQNIPSSQEGAAITSGDTTKVVANISAAQNDNVEISKPAQDKYQQYVKEALATVGEVTLLN
ncbi:hypothetical protein [Zymobacter sp. IVIA_5232.4 C2]|uniref:hypothetical protein n=1 Tax=Zymobacter sp. IVIA_5232.4 C2 TaxID=3394855 RepID=UPI0039C3BFF6